MPSRPIPEDIPAQAARLFALRDELTDTIHENIGDLAAQAPQDPADIAVVDHARSIAEAILSTYEVRPKRQAPTTTVATVAGIYGLSPQPWHVGDEVAVAPSAVAAGRNPYDFGKVMSRVPAGANGIPRYIVDWYAVPDSDDVVVHSDEYHADELRKRHA